MYAENEPAMKMNDADLNGLPGELYTIKAGDKILSNYKYPLEMGRMTIQDAQDQKQANTGGLSKLI